MWTFLLTSVPLVMCHCVQFAKRQADRDAAAALEYGLLDPPSIPKSLDRTLNRYATWLCGGMLAPANRRYPRLWYSVLVWSAADRVRV